jgi:hypothetical protein
MPSRTVNPFLRQRFYNRSSQANWRAFASHREQITSRLEAAACHGNVSVAPSLCILGAGNCNDLDLARLTARREHIHLVDIDAEAMQSGVANQFDTAGEAARLRRSRIGFTACDLTGALELCHEITQFPSPQGFARLRAALTQLPAAVQLRQQYTTVASTCLLSQLLEIFQRAIGETSPEFRTLAELIRLQHLRTLASLTAPGGTALLFADFVSSESYPELLNAPPGALASIMDRVLSQDHCFPGMNPSSICRLLAEPPLAAYWVETPTMSPPWVWNLGPRSYLVTAITCRRKWEEDRSPLALS